MIETVGIVGGGAMGVSLAALFLVRNFNVVLLTRRAEAAKQIKEKAQFYAAKIEPNYGGKINVVTDYTALASASLVVETVEEKMNAKREVLAEIEKAAPKAFYASNTSSLSIGEIAAALKDKTKLVGLHFFNPAHKMQLVEIVKTAQTSEQCIEFMQEIARKLSKTSVIVSDSPGFVVNRLLFPFLLEAAKLKETGAADVRSIDTAVKLGLNHPMGPFELMDLIGLDVVLSILSELKNRTGDKRFEAPKSIVELVNAGRLGRKTKHGFYDYE